MSPTSRVVIADSSPLTRQWLANAVRLTLAPGGSELAVARDGAELLDRLAEDTIDLVVTQAVLPHISGAQVLAMVRTTGMHTPFVLLDHLPSNQLRSMVDRVGHALLVDDPFDACAIETAIGLLHPRHHGGWLRATPRSRPMVAQSSR